MTSLRDERNNLLESDQRFQTLADTAPVLIWMSDQSKGRTYFNMGWCDFTGRDQADLLGNGWAQDVHPDDLNEYTKIYENSFDARHPFSMEYRLRRHDGEYRWIIDTGVPRWKDETVFIGFIGSCFDITERKQAEVGLRDSKEHYRAIIEAFDGQIYICSHDYRILFMNEKMIERTGRNAVGEPCFSALHDLEAICPWCVNERVFKGESVRWEVKSPKDDRWYYVANSPIYNEDGTISKQAMIRDITEQKQAEEERRALEQQFHHAQKLESLGVLAGGIAHDFNNILTIILGNCYLAREDMIPELSYKELFQQIETAGNRAADLCRQMLTYAGKSPLVQTHVDLCSLVDDVVKMLQAAIKKNVTIEIDMKHDVPEIKGDAGQIQQIIMNLIINAAEAIGDTNGIIRVLLTKTVVGADKREIDTFGTAILPGTYTCLEVTDTGIGMDDETQKRIFEPFYTTKFTGRGLGMSAIRGIVTSHEGILHLTSTAGVGSTFKVCFPVPEPSEYAETASTASIHSEMKCITILLVEDELNLRDIGSTLLKTMGFSVLAVQDGREALKVYRERLSEIDVVLLDLIMPTMGGVETYAELRKITTSLPIIICSGYGIETVSDVINNDLYAGFIHKPYNPEQLREMIIKMKN
jgi:two-component system, cell cycle sensor histidine kinase and response regulator CckA